MMCIGKIKILYAELIFYYTKNMIHFILPYLCPVIFAAFSDKHDLSHQRSFMVLVINYQLLPTKDRF